MTPSAPTPMSTAMTRRSATSPGCEAEEGVIAPAPEVDLSNIRVGENVMIVNMTSRRRSKRPPKAAYHHGDLARALVQAAHRLIEQGDSPRLTLREAAQAAGVSAAAPYRHFADREALLAAVLAGGFRELARRTDEARRAAPDPMSAVLGVGLAYVAFAGDHPRTYRLMFGPECDKTRYPDLMAAGH